MRDWSKATCAHCGGGWAYFVFHDVRLCLDCHREAVA